MSRVIYLVTLLLTAVIAGCSSPNPGGPDADSSDADLDADLDADNEGDDSSVDADEDQPAPDCDLLLRLEEEATTTRETLWAAMEIQGYEPWYGADTEVRVSSSDRETVIATDFAPSVFSSEAEILALPEDDRLREDYLSGELGVLDWETVSLLVYWELNPYTDTYFFDSPERFEVVTVRLEACLPEAAEPPRECLRRLAVEIPRGREMTHTFERHPYRMPTFTPDPAWTRSLDNPLINRRGGNAYVLELDGLYHLWIEGYSGASGMIFHATSPDGIDWGFSWDRADQCTFEDLPDITVWKNDPCVIFRDGRYRMWFSAEDLTYTATSSDGIDWIETRPVSGLSFIGGGRAQPHVVLVEEDGLVTYRMYGQTDVGSDIFTSVSEDGLTWDTPEVVLTQGESVDDLDGAGAFQPFVLRTDEGWLMFLATLHNPRRANCPWGWSYWAYQWHIALATSPDGLSWTRAEQPILSQILTPDHWEAGGLGRPVVLRQGEEWRLYYTGVEGGEPSMGLAVASGWTPPAP